MLGVQGPLHEAPGEAEAAFTAPAFTTPTFTTAALLDHLIELAVGEPCGLEGAEDRGAEAALALAAHGLLDGGGLGCGLSCGLARALGPEQIRAPLAAAHQVRAARDLSGEAGARRASLSRRLGDGYEGSDPGRELVDLLPALHGGELAQGGEALGDLLKGLRQGVRGGGAEGELTPDHRGRLPGAQAQGGEAPGEADDLLDHRGAAVGGGGQRHAEPAQG